jgi:RNA binding exosome subunit
MKGDADVAKFTKKERDAIGVFLTDLHHEKEMRRSMEMLCEKFSKEELQTVIGRFAANGTLTYEDKVKLLRRIEKVFQSL